MFFHEHFILKTIDIQCKHSAHLLQSEIASVRKEIETYQLNETDDAYLLQSHPKLLSIEDLTEITSLITTEERKM